MSKPRLLGHRGALARAPENTLASMRMAVAEGADGFEFDVRLTGDGAAVLLHDASLARTTGRDAELSATPLAAARQLDAGAWFSEEHAGERIPRLTEVLDEFLGQVPLAMEMKELLPEAALRDVADRLHREGSAELILASFQADPLRAARDWVPAAPRALILRQEDPLPDPELQQELGLWGIFARQEAVDDRFVVEARRAGLSLYVYTVNDAARATQLAAAGVNGIISDDPGAIRRGLD